MPFNLSHEEGRLWLLRVGVVGLIWRSIAWGDGSMSADPWPALPAISPLEGRWRSVLIQSHTKLHLSIYL